MAGHSNFVEPEVIPVDKGKVLKIWKTAGILAFVTLIEFVFAFQMERGYSLVAIFVALTIVKAFFIMWEFMHLGHEEKSLRLSIMIPLIFLLWLILACLLEADAILIAINTYWKTNL